MRACAAVGLGVILLLGGCGEGEKNGRRSEELQAFQRFLVQYHLRYPGAQAQDYYKLIFQSAFGVRHWIQTEASAREGLEEEISGLEPARASEPLLEPLDPLGRMVRVNLRPFVAQNLSLDALVAVFVETARTVEADTTLFLARWGAFRELVEMGRIGVEAADFEKVDRFAKENGYPAMHHSDAYRDAYKPAYRVVTRDLFIREVPSSYRER